MRPRLLAGIVIILVGGLLLLGNLDIVDPRAIWNLWPVILLVAGLNMIFRTARGGGWEGGMVLTVIGAAFLLRNLGLLDWRWRHLWPLLLIIIGVVIVVSAFRPLAAPKPKHPPSDSSPTLSLFTALGGVDHRNNSTAFRGGEASAVMGGVEIDLRDAKLADTGAEIECNVFMGGIEIRVPQDWCVEVKGSPILGYFGDTTHASRAAAAATTTNRLVVRGRVLMGAVEVKN